MRLQITLHPKVASLVKRQVSKGKKTALTRFQKPPVSKPSTADELVNEIIWLALRTGEISKHYTE